MGSNMFQLNDMLFSNEAIDHNQLFDWKAHGDGFGDTLAPDMHLWTQDTYSQDMEPWWGWDNDVEWNSAMQVMPMPEFPSYAAEPNAYSDDTLFHSTMASASSGSEPSRPDTGFIFREADSVLPNQPSPASATASPTALINVSRQDTLPQPVRRHQQRQQQEQSEPARENDSRVGIRCRSCDVRWPNSSSLREHNEGTHSRPFHCLHEGCRWSWPTRKDLRRHAKVHAREREFRCPIDGCEYLHKGFKRRDVFRTHMRRRHSGIFDGGERGLKVLEGLKGAYGIVF